MFCLEIEQDSVKKDHNHIAEVDKPSDKYFPDINIANQVIVYCTYYAILGYGLLHFNCFLSIVIPVVFIIDKRSAGWI